LVPESIVPQAAYHMYRIAEARNRNGLVCSLAARVNLKICTHHCLADSRYSPHDRDKVSIDASDNNHGLLTGHCVSPRQEIHQTTI
jgi:hypothetical protein